MSLGKDIKQIETIDGRAGADTIRLWESYRDQARLWRALTVLQLPATVIAIVMAILTYVTADTYIEVPEKPLPGQYSVRQLPDDEFISVATQIVNLISVYQAGTARDQFKMTRKYLWEPALSIFERRMVDEEARVIEQTNRSQVFFIDTKQIKVERHPELDKVIVRLTGIRQKLIGDRALPPDEMTYYITLTTIPRNLNNDLGIVAVDIRLKANSLKLIPAQPENK